MTCKGNTETFACSENVQRPAWYGGNKIPASYLAKFKTGSNKESDLPYELEAFLHLIDDERIKEKT